MADGAPVPPTGEGVVPSQGTQPFDPTQNVLNLVTAAIQRQDDLREMQAEHERYIAELRAEYEEKLRQAHDAKADLRAADNDKLRLAESARIDAIRAVDVGAVNRAAEVSATQASTLATQVATSAEALRGQVEAARQQTATALAAALEPIQKDIQDLRRAQYEAQGVKAQGTEQRLNTGQLIGIIGLVLAAAAVIVTILLATGH
jgi:hypothetical protein